MQITVPNNNFKENMLCLLAALVFSIAFMAILCGDGNKGFLDLF